MTTAETYVTAAFLVFLAIAIAYVVIYSFRMRRLDREVSELERRGLDPARPEQPGPEPGA